MENRLEKKYGLVTAICAVIGIIIGSGVFFKAQAVMRAGNGNMGTAIAIVVVMGLIMFVCAFTFSTLAGEYEKVNGLVDYAECTVGRKYAYLVNWFSTVVYTPVITSVLAWVSARYFCVLVGWDGEPFGPKNMILTAFVLIMVYAINVLSPKFAGKFQVSTTFIKLVPLLLMGIIGTIVGLINGTTIQTFTTAADTGDAAYVSFFSGIAAFAFAYEGWIVITSLNAEIKNSKRNLPLALIFGCAAAIGIYVLYYVGIASVLKPDEIYSAADLPKLAFTRLFNSPVFGSIVYAFIVVSCVGTCNALMMGCTRGVYSMAVRGQGVAPQVLSQVDPKTNMPQNSATVGLVLCTAWITQFILCFQAFYINEKPLLPASFAWESDEVVILTMYVTYIPIFIAFMFKGKNVNWFKRYITPLLAVFACLFIAYSAYKAYAHDGQIWNYLATFAVIMLIGIFCYGGKFDFAFFKKEKN